MPTVSPTTQWTEARRRFLPLLAGGIGAGALFGTVFNPLITLLFFSLLSCAFGVFLAIPRAKVSFAILFAALFFFSGVLGASRAWIFSETIPRELAQFENQSVTITGVVSADPDTRETTLRAPILIDSVNGNKLSGKILVSTDRFAPLSYGDRVEARGVLKRPDAFETDTGRIFNYPRFLFAHRITHTVSFGKVVVVESGKGNPIMQALVRLKNAFVARIEQTLPDPEAPLLSGLLLGEKQSLGSGLYASLQRAGVVHMIVLSGYNVSLVVKALLASTRAMLPRNASFAIASLGIVAFALMTGATETTIRASIMAGVLIMASVLGRPHDALRALLVAAAIMLLVNPFILMYDLSFQLSFLATAGIILFADAFSRRLTFLSERFGIREIGGATLSAQLSVLPLLILSLGNVSLVAPLANIAVLAAVPWAMLFGFVSGLAAFIGTWFAAPFTVVAYALLEYILVVSVWFGNLPFASITVPPSLGAWLVPVVFLSYGVLIFLSRQKTFIAR